MKKNTNATPNPQHAYFETSKGLFLNFDRIKAIPKGLAKSRMIIIGVTIALSYFHNALIMGKKMLVKMLAKMLRNENRQLFFDLIN